MKNIIIYGSDERFVKMLKLECDELFGTLGAFGVYTVNALRENSLQALYELTFTKLQGNERYFIGESDAIERRDERNLHKLLANFEKNDISFVLYGKGVSTADPVQYIHMHGFFRMPFSVDEFLKCAYSMIFSKKEPENDSKVKTINTQPTLDNKLFTIALNGKKCLLSPREFELFKALYEKHGDAVSRSELNRAVWRNESNTNVCDVYINYLRNKLKSAGIPITIQTVRGVGYRMM